MGEETKIESRLRKKVESLGGAAYKFISPGRSGVPDRLVILPGDRIYFLELKAPGKAPRPLQRHEISRLQKLGCDVRVIDSAESVDKFISEVMPK